jgi:hypothetical protein
MVERQPLQQLAWTAIHSIAGGFGCGMLVALLCEFASNGHLTLDARAAPEVMSTGETVLLFVWFGCVVASSLRFLFRGEVA